MSSLGASEAQSAWEFYTVSSKIELFQLNIGRYSLSAAWYIGGYNWIPRIVLLGSNPCTRWRLDIAKLGVRFEKY